MELDALKEEKSGEELCETDPVELSLALPRVDGLGAGVAVPLEDEEKVTAIDCVRTGVGVCDTVEQADTDCETLSEIDDDCETEPVELCVKLLATVIL